MICERRSVPYSLNTVKKPKQTAKTRWKQDYMVCTVDGKLSIAISSLSTLHPLRQQLKIIFEEAWTFHNDVSGACFQRKKIPACWINFSLILRMGDQQKKQNVWGIDCSVKPETGLCNRIGYFPLYSGCKMLLQALMGHVWKCSRESKKRESNWGTSRSTRPQVLQYWVGLKLAVLQNWGLWKIWQLL